MMHDHANSILADRQQHSQQELVLILIFAEAIFVGIQSVLNNS